MNSYNQLVNNLGFRHLDSVNDMLDARGLDRIDIARYREVIGVPIIKFYEKVFEPSLPLRIR